MKLIKMLGLNLPIWFLSYFTTFSSCQTKERVEKENKRSYGYFFHYHLAVFGGFTCT